MATLILKLGTRFISLVCVLSLLLTTVACAPDAEPPSNEAASIGEEMPIQDTSLKEADTGQKTEDSRDTKDVLEDEVDKTKNIESSRAALNLIEDYRPSFTHGEKPAQYQKYIMLHDTEGDSSPQSVVDWWDGNGNLVAAHFIVGKDGTIVQCAPLDAIVHHAGFGDAGHNASFDVEDETRDDKLGTVPIGSWASDYGMNSYSIGIELVHIGGHGDYPEAQLNALDALIVYIDSYYGFQSQIIDHKSWRSGNSDTSPEFAGYLESYQTNRSHKGI